MIIALLVFQMSFSQIKDSGTKNSLIKFFDAKETVEYFKVNKEPKNHFPEIIKLEIKDIENNTEGKFGLNESNQKYFSATNTESVNTIFNAKNNITETEVSSNLETNTKQKLIKAIIKKKIAVEIRDFILQNEALTYGDRNLEEYKNLVNLENKLIQTVSVSNDVELQLGKDIYPYLNKILKTELDKTLQNSLNLFAINF